MNLISILDSTQLSYRSIETKIENSVEMEFTDGNNKRDKSQRHSRWHPQFETTIECQNNDDQPLPTVKKRKHHESVLRMETEFRQLSISRFDRCPMNSERNRSVQYGNDDCSFRRINYMTLSNDDLNYFFIHTPVTTVNLTFMNYLRNETLLVYIRQYASMLDQIVYLELEHEQWDVYYRKSSDNGIWSRRVSRKWAKQNTLVHCYGRSIDHVKDRREHVARELCRLRNELQLFEKQTLSPLNIDIELVSSIVRDCIRYRQRHLIRHFQWKQQILMFDIEDHRLVQCFYDMNPNSDQSRCAQAIWRWTKEKMNLRASLDLVTYHLDRNLSVLMKTWMNQRRPDSVAMNHWRKIVGLTSNMSNNYLSFGRTMLEQIEEKIRNEKDVLVNLSKNDSKKSEEMLRMIEQREQNLSRRSMCIQHEQLLSFFDRNTFNF